jgi:hypothetical protein
MVADEGDSMNREDIIRMAREVGLEKDGDNFFSPKSDPQVDVHITDLGAFASLVASAERERLTDAAMKAAEKAVDVAIALERERLAKVFDELDKGIGFYDPHEPAEIIRGQA